MFPRFFLLSGLILSLLLAGCGDLPRPFEGRPGGLARRLAQPPPARLAVPPPTTALLSDRASAAFAREIAEALAAESIPAVAEKAKPGDWRLGVSATMQGETVVPSYAIFDARGRKQGSERGAAVPAASWAQGGAPVLQAAAAQAAPGIADLLSGVDAARKESDPNSLFNRPARVDFTGVTGAPGDGDDSLALQMQRQLPTLGFVLQKKDAGADYVVTGKVRTAPAAGGAERVEITWIVTDATGRESGRVSQINDVAAGTLDHYWGDVAMVVVQEAAGGIKRVIDNAAGITQARAREAKSRKHPGPASQPAPAKEPQ